jgi:hypothetical protein
MADAEVPDGMSGLADEIGAAGMQPGLWMAPFYVSQLSETYAEHPDWWVLDDSDEPIVFTGVEEPMVILDVTNLEAAAWLQEQIRDKVDAGYTYLKLDFLYAGAQEGTRVQALTGVQAYRLGLDLIREAAGEGTWIRACGAPMLPTVGFAEQYRTGADISFVLSPDPELAYLRWQARSTAARSWQNGLWWWVDPDALLVREPFTEVEATGAVAAQVASGGAWLLGDGLAELPADRLNLALNRLAADTRGQWFWPVDPLSYPSGIDGGPPLEQGLPNDQVPPLWQAEDGTVILLNLGEEELVVTGPGGREILSGAAGEAGEARSLAPGAGELWIP